MTSATSFASTQRTTMVWKCLHDAAPRYLADLCVPAALLVPWTRTSTGQRSFATYGPRTCMKPTTNGPPITRTVALFIQAPAQDPLVCSSTRQCWLQLWVSCTVVWRCCDCTASSAPTTNVQTRLSTRRRPESA